MTYKTWKNVEQSSPILILAQYSILLYMVHILIDYVTWLHPVKSSSMSCFQDLNGLVESSVYAHDMPKAGCDIVW